MSVRYSGMQLGGLGHGRVGGRELNTYSGGLV